MKPGEILMRTLRVAARECGQMARNPIYLFCMVVFPIVVIYFFTSVLADGQPQNLHVGVVDQDHTATTRSMIHHLDAFQSTHVAAYYPTAADARKAIQRGEIYAFLLIPEGTTAQLVASRQPHISFYYSATMMLPGSLLFRDLKTITTLGAAAMGQAKLQMLGKTNEEIKDFLQPITIDLHMTNNPWSDYNVYLSSIMIPGILSIFMFLITVYSIGTELKFGRGRDWLRLAGNNIVVALTGKLLPQFLIFTTIFTGFMTYTFGYLHFPHPGGLHSILLLTLLMVLASEGFGIFMFGLMPSLRMSMSLCSLWGVLGVSICGATFPVFAMDPILQGLSYLFPLRHYWMVYQLTIFNGFPFGDAYLNLAALLLFALLPLLTMYRTKKAMLEYVYIP